MWPIVVEYVFSLLAVTGLSAHVAGSDDAEPCPPLALVREPVLVDNDNAPDAWRNITVTARRRPTTHGGATAATSSRESLVYVSQGHVIDIAILTSSDNAEDVPYFMLKYEGTTRTPLRSVFPISGCSALKVFNVMRYTKFRFSYLLVYH